MCKTLQQVGIEVEVHHHEVANAGQCEIGTRFNTLVQKADELLTMKYIIKNVAHRNGKTATFMPKPIVGDNGSGMHVHQSLAKGGVNLFTGDGYGGLSQMALWYIGGIFKHARAINAFANSTTNSYKRLVPGFEAPVMLAYSASNRSASCRIPYVANPKARRIEIRFPDPMNSGYLIFAALMMAGLDGIRNQIDPGAPSDKDLYDLPPEEEKNIPTVCHSLDQALEALDKDRDFLKAGGVMTDDFIDAYIGLKMKEVTAVPRGHPPARIPDVLRDLVVPSRPLHPRPAMCGPRRRLPHNGAMSAVPPPADLDALTTPVLWAAADGRIVGANLAFGRWLGVSGRRLPGMPLAALEADGDVLARWLAQAPPREFGRLRRLPLAFPGNGDGPRFADVSVSLREDGGWWLEAHPVDEFPGEDPALALPRRAVGGPEGPGA